MKLAHPRTAVAKTTATTMPTVGNPSDVVLKSLVEVDDAVVEVVDAVLEVVELEVAVDDSAVVVAVALVESEVVLDDAEVVLEVVAVEEEADVVLVDDAEDEETVELVVLLSSRSCSCLNSMTTELPLVTESRAFSHRSANRIVSTSASSLVHPASARQVCREGPS